MWFAYRSPALGLQGQGQDNPEKGRAAEVQRLRHNHDRSARPQNSESPPLRAFCIQNARRLTPYALLPSRLPAESDYRMCCGGCLLGRSRVTVRDAALMVLRHAVKRK